MLSITKRIFCGLFIALAVVNAAISPLQANAQDVTDVLKVAVPGLAVADAIVGGVSTGIGENLKAAFLWIFMFIPYLSGGFGALFLQLAAGLVDLMVNFNISVLGGGNIVTLGFGISLNIVNLLFVLALIIIALGTILRIQAYGMKQLLAKLIIAAILINFSLAIAGLLLDFSHVFTTFFLNGGQTSASEQIQVSANLAGALSPQDFSRPPDLSLARDAVDQGLFWTKKMNSLFRAVFTWILAIVMLGVAFMFLIRYFYVVILLILMPFAWFFSVVPEYSNLTKKWWNKFLEQVFFLPGMAFFIYLAIQLQNTVDAALEARISGVGSQAAAAFSQGLGTGDFFKTVLNQIIISGILVGGLIAAQKMGIAGSSTAMGIAKWSKNLVVGGAAGGAKWIGRKSLQFGQKIDPNTGKVTGGVGNALATTAARFGFTGAASAIKGAITNKQAIENYRKEVDNLSGEQVIAALKAPGLAYNQEKLSVLYEKAAKMKLTDKIYADKSKNDAFSRAAMDAARKTGLSKSILESRPDLGTAEEMKNTIGKMSPKDIIEKIDPVALEKMEVAKLIKDKQVENILQNASSAMQESLLRGREKMAAELAEEMRLVSKVGTIEDLPSDMKEKIINIPEIKFVINNPMGHNFITKENTPELHRILEAAKAIAKEETAKEKAKA